MAYKVINDFYDSDNNKFHYKKGDIYPQGDYKPSKDRLGYLVDVHPKYKKAFIAEIQEAKEAEKSEDSKVKKEKKTKSKE